MALSRTFDINASIPFQGNVSDTVGRQIAPSLTPLAGGGSAVAYGSAVDVNRVAIDLYDASGLRTNGFVGDYGLNYALVGGPDVIQLAGGKIVVAFASQTPARPGVYAQFLSADGVAEPGLTTLDGGFPTAVNVYTSQVSLTPLADGAFMMAATYSPGASPIVLLARFNANGTRQNATIESGRRFGISEAVIAELSDGGLALAMADESGALVVRTYNANLTPRGVLTVAGAANVAVGVQPSITALDDGRFAVASVSTATAEAPGAAVIRLQVFEADGSLVPQAGGADGLTIGSSLNAESEPSVVHLGAGVLAASWTLAHPSIGPIVLWRVVQVDDGGALSIASNIVFPPLGSASTSLSDIAAVSPDSFVVAFQDETTDVSAGRIGYKVVTLGDAALQGDDADDVLTEAPGVAELRGGGGADVFFLSDGAGLSVVDGEGGVDTLSIAGEGDGVDLRSAELRDLERIAFEPSVDGSSRVVRLRGEQLTAANGMDALEVSGSVGHVPGRLERIFIDIDAGELDLSGWTFVDFDGELQRIGVTSATSDDEPGVTIRDSSVSDSLSTGAGDDVIVLARGGADTVSTRAGDDLIVYRSDGLSDAGGLSLNGGADSDELRIEATSNAATIFDFTGGYVASFETLTIARDGDALIEVRLGADQLTGLREIDVASAGRTRIVLSFETQDSFSLGPLTSLNFDGDDELILRQGGANRILIGSRFDEVIHTGVAGSTIEGRGGDDRIIVEGGVATVTGGDDADTFRPRDGTVRMVVTDFRAHDDAPDTDVLDLREFSAAAVDAALSGAVEQDGGVTLFLQGRAGITEVRLDGLTPGDLGGMSILRATAPRLNFEDPRTNEDVASYGVEYALTHDDPFSTPALREELADLPFGRLTVVANGWTLEPTAGVFDELAEGESTQVVIPLTSTLGFALDAALTIEGRNDAPTAFDHGGAAFFTDEDTPLVFDLRSGAVDPDDALLAITRINGEAVSDGAPIDLGSDAGTLTRLEDGSIRFAPSAADQAFGEGASRFVSFHYDISDPSGAFDVGRAEIRVSGVNDAPVAQDDAASLGESGSASIDLLVNDSDVDAHAEIGLVSVDGRAPGETFDVVSAGGRTARATAPPLGGGTLVFEAAGGFEDLKAGETDAATLSYIVSDGLGGTDVGEVVFTVVGENDAPTARNDAATVAEDRAVAGQALVNDDDVDGDAIAVAWVGGDPAGVGVEVAGLLGTLLLQADGGFVYRADRADAMIAGRSAVDRFEYRITDGAGGVADGELVFTVEGRDEVLRGKAVADALRGGGGDDRLVGRGGDDVLRGGGGDDAMIGGGGDDRLFGQGGADTLKGGGGDDNLAGGGGDDAIFGQRGKDKLKGGVGRDDFHFKRGDGHDVILDWNDRQDEIHIDKGTKRFGQLEIYQKGKHAYVEYGKNGDVIKLVRTDADDLDAGDFAF